MLVCVRLCKRETEGEEKVGNSVNEIGQSRVARQCTENKQEVVIVC